MSKSVLELAVETGQWTGGLKKAQNALQNFTQASGSTSEAISKSGDKMAQFVSRMGNMESKAKTATGRLKEMENVYKELAVQYKQLTDQERQTTYGKALNQSLSQLQTRIKSARVDIQSVNAELGTGRNGMGNAMQQLASKMGLPIASLGKLSVGLAAASAAAKVLKDAFMQSETNADEWGAALEEARGSYNTFLATINGGNWTSFFTNLREAITGAKELYEALDRLDTVKGVNAAAIAIEQKTIQELRKQAREGKDVTAELEQHTATLLKLQNQSVVAGKDAGQKTMREAITNTMNARTGEHATDQDVTAAIDRLLKEGVSALDSFTKENSDLNRKGMEAQYMRGTDGVTRLTGYEFNIEKLTKEEQARYNLTKAIIESEAEWRKGISTYASAVGEGASAIKENIKADNYGNQKGGGTGSGNAGKSSDVQKTVMAINADVVRGLQDKPIADAIRQQFDGKPIPVQVEVVEYEEVGDDSVILKNLNERYAAIQKINEGIEEMNIILASNADAGTKAWASAQLEEYQTQLDSLNGKLKETAESIAEIQSAMEKMQTGIGAMESVVGSIKSVRNAFKNMTETMQEDGDAWDKMMSVYDAGMSVLKCVVGVMEAINTLTEMSTALKAASTAATATDTAALGAHATAETVDAAETAVNATAEGADAAAKAGKAVSWIPIVGPVLAVAAIASVAAAIAASRSKTEYHADGGFAGMMQPRGTDVVPAMLTPGELVLNRAQQRNLAGQLTGTAGPQTVVVTGRISGRDILLAADNDNRSRGGSRGYYAKTH